jgi:hypothetical protein
MPSTAAAVRLALALALVLAGCSSAHSVLPAQHAATPPAAEPSHVALAAPDGHAGRFLQLADAVCRTVRHGAPSSLHEQPTPAMLARYASAWQAPSRRVEKSLQRLAARAPEGVTLGSLIGAYRRLEGNYEDASRAPAGQLHHWVTILAEDQQRTARAARASGLALCAP